MKNAPNPTSPAEPHSPNSRNLVSALYSAECQLHFALKIVFFRARDLLYNSRKRFPFYMNQTIQFTPADMH
jgi:hypothetical protein